MKNCKGCRRGPGCLSGAVAYSNPWISVLPGRPPSQVPHAAGRGPRRCCRCVCSEVSACGPRGPRAQTGARRWQRPGWGLRLWRRRAGVRPTPSAESQSVSSLVPARGAGTLPRGGPRSCPVGRPDVTPGITDCPPRRPLAWLAQLHPSPLAPASRAVCRGSLWERGWNLGRTVPAHIGCGLAPRLCPAGGPRGAGSRACAPPTGIPLRAVGVCILPPMGPSSFLPHRSACRGHATAQSRASPPRLADSELRTHTGTSAPAWDGPRSGQSPLVSDDSPRSGPARLYEM